MIYNIDENNVNKRIDVFLSENGFTRNMAQNMIDDKSVSVNSKIVKKKYKLALNDVVDIEEKPIKETEILAEDIPLDIIYEDGDIIVVNKKRGMVVHPAIGNWTGTLVNALMHHCKDSLSGINGEHRPGIVHRIDKDTSGLIVVAKNDLAHLSLAHQIKEHSASRVYEAIVNGHMRETAGVINKPIGRHHTDRKKMAVTDRNSREAITHYEVLKDFKKYTYMRFKLETGRTHQIRVHMASINHPIIGDAVYNPFKDEYKLNGQCLHAKELVLKHPRSGEQMHFESPLPKYFITILDKLEKM